MSIGVRIGKSGGAQPWAFQRPSISMWMQVRLLRGWPIMQTFAEVSRSVPGTPPLSTIQTASASSTSTNTGTPSQVAGGGTSRLWSAPLTTFLFTHRRWSASDTPEYQPPDQVAPPSASTVVPRISGIVVRTRRAVTCLFHETAGGASARGAPPHPETTAAAAIAALASVFRAPAELALALLSTTGRPGAALPGGSSPPLPGWSARRAWP